MATIRRFEDLQIWQLAKEIYQIMSALASKIKLAKDFRFADQLKAAAGSVMDNIAEGFEMDSRLEFVNSLSISKGEAGELKSQQYRALNDQYITEDEFKFNYTKIEVLMMRIAKLINYLNTTDQRGLKFKGRVK